MAKSLLEAKEVASPMSDVDTYIRFFREKEMAKALLSKRDLNAAQKKKESALIETNFKKTVENLEHVRAEAHQIMSERRESEDEAKARKPRQEGIDEVGAELLKGKKRREPRQAGGSMMVPPEMEDVVSSEAPVDTYPNIPPEEMAEAEASQLPDEEMEGDYVDFVISEALDQEEQNYLTNALEADPQLSMIFDKVVDTASEFSGAGEVSGPGTGVSDSIPARLSDGEFVVTKKATDQIGADNLQTMMDEAERAFDGGLMEKDRGIEDEEIRKSMVASNQMPSLNVRQR